MNTNQQSNIISTVVQLLMAALVAHGKITNSEAQEITGAIGSLIMFLVSHNWHATPPASGSAPQLISSVAGKVVGAFLLFFALTGTLVFTGCGTVNETAFRAAGTVHVSVDTALHLYNVAAAQGKTTVAQNNQVAAAYDKYQKAFAVACDAGASYAASSVTNSAGVSGAQAALQEAQSDAAASLADLENLITSFGVNL